jgi:hypothetical protein
LPRSSGYLHTGRGEWSNEGSLESVGIPGVLSIAPVVLDAAIAATFARRVTVIPSVAPAGLTIAFSGYYQTVQQWTTYAESIGLEAVSLGQFVTAIWAYLEPSCARLTAAKHNRTPKTSTTSPVQQCRTGRGCGGQLPFEVRPRDQMRFKVLPSSSANRLAKIGALKLGSSSLIER